MTRGEAVGRLDLLMPNSLPAALKAEWLTALDGRVRRDICGGREGNEAGEGVAVSPAPEDPELLIPPPEDTVIYTNYLLAQASAALGEQALFSFYYALFSEALARYIASVSRGRELSPPPAWRL